MAEAPDAPQSGPSGGEERQSQQEACSQSGSHNDFLLHEFDRASANLLEIESKRYRSLWFLLAIAGAMVPLMEASGAIGSENPRPGQLAMGAGILLVGAIFSGVVAWITWFQMSSIRRHHCQLNCIRRHFLGVKDKPKDKALTLYLEHPKRYRSNTEDQRQFSKTSKLLFVFALLLALILFASSVAFGRWALCYHCRAHPTMKGTCEFYSREGPEQHNHFSKRPHFFASP